MSATTCLPNQYKHENNLCCDLCPKGKYVLTDCTQSSPTVCKTCEHDTYTDQDNYMKTCQHCRRCQNERDSNQRELKPCYADSDRKCECVDGFYCSTGSNGHCEHCIPVHNCEPGSGVFTKSTRTSNTICKTCITGTFSNVTDKITPCFNHTNCEKLGRTLLIQGTTKTDAVCGDLIPRHCPWVLPAALWSGLVITIIICSVIAIVYWYFKRKSQQTVITSVCSDSYVSPVLPPDVIKHPNSPELQKFFHRDEIFNNTESCLECDGLTMTTITASEKFAVGHCGRFTTSDPSILQSEPQEDEWNGI